MRQAQKEISEKTIRTAAEANPRARGFGGKRRKTQRPTAGRRNTWLRY